MVSLERWHGTTTGWKHALQPRGTWYAYPLGPSESNTDRRLADGTRVSVYVVCPACGKTSTILHAIAADGALSPSLVCPHAGCTWHVFVRLVGWTGGHVPVVAGVRF